MHAKFFPALLALLLLLAACSASPLASAGQPNLPDIVWRTPGPSPTPFQPLPPTPTYLPTSYPTRTLAPTPTPDLLATPTRQAGAPVWGNYSGPTVWPDVQIEPPVLPFSFGAGQTTILLLGADQRPGSSAFRTDTIMLLILDPAAGRASLVSFPRDLYVYIPGWTVQRINAAMIYGSYEMLAQTFEYNFGFCPDYYIMIQYTVFAEVVDSLEGVDVQVAQAFEDENGSVEAGLVHMDGETALWYVRSRKSTSDMDRARRQQEVLYALYNRLLSLNALNRAPELYESYRSNVTTDMAFADMARFMPLAAQMSDQTRLSTYVIRYPLVTGYITAGFADVLLPDRDAIRQLLSEASDFTK